MASQQLLNTYKAMGMKHLHVHTDASHLDGCNDISSYIKRLKDIGHTAAAITDHGNMHNVLRFYQACLVHDIKPILGFEAYITDARQLQKKSDFQIVEEFIGDDFAKETNHLVLLAENFKGYQNLCALTSRSFDEGVYSKPRIDYEILREHSEGVIAVNGHVGTDIAVAFERACYPVSATEADIMKDTKFSNVVDFRAYIEGLAPEAIEESGLNIGKLKAQLSIAEDDAMEHAAVIVAEKEAYRVKEMERAYTLNEWYKEVFGDRYYLEVQNHNVLQIERDLNPLIFELANYSGVPVVMTNDVHYTYKEDADAQRIHFANGLGQTYEEFMTGGYEGFSTCDEFYVKSDEEMLEMALPYGDEAVQALLNTNELADRCNVTFDAIELKGTEMKKGKLVGKWKTREYLFPEFQIPMPFNTKEAYFEHLAAEGLKERIREGEVDLEGYTEEDYWKRLKYEMGVINDMGFPTYFIILWDVLRFCREEQIPVGKGRGSGAGSLVAHSLRITDVDPLKYDLLFERFLNPDRISMPDIDLDFCYDRIQEVIDYTKNRYGHDYVCKIGTYGTLSAKAVIKDVARVLRYDYQTINSLTTQVQEVGIKIAKILTDFPAFSDLYEGDAEFKRLIDVSMRLEGMQRHTSQHAAGVIISPFPLTDLIPLKGRHGDSTAQFDMVELETLGFVKMDYLRLRTLTVIKNAVDSIREQLGEHIDIDKINFEDDAVFKNFREAESLGIFQFESDGMQSLLRNQGPASIEDLSAANALYRPGPLDMKIEEETDPNFGLTMVDIFLKRAKGHQEVAYDHPLLQTVLNNTYGVFVYQEQVMRASVVLAQFTLPEADELRSVVGKKKLDQMPIQHEKFVKGCLTNEAFTREVENPRAVAEFIFKQIETFARYGFNKSHATAYALLAYQSMWLKTYYPEFFMASVLTSLIGEKIEKVIPYLNECRRLDISLLPPDVNHSTLKFEVSKDRKGIHFSLNGIKGVGTKAVEDILEAKKMHAFRTLSDFIMLTGSSVNKTVTIALAQAGAFDFLGYNRRTMVQVVEDLVVISGKVKQKISANKRKKKPDPDISQFYEPFYDYQVEVLEEFPHEDLCSMERNLTGFYITNHPLEGLIHYIQSKTTHTADAINNGYLVENAFYPEMEELNTPLLAEPEYAKLPEGQFVITGGVVKQVKEITIKRGKNIGKKMASIVIEDAYQGDIRCTVFNSEYEKLSHIIEVGKIMFIKGNIDYFNDNAQINVREISPVSRDSAKNLMRNELLENIADMQKAIAEIEETMELLGDDADLIVNITDELFAYYDRMDECRQELERLEFAS